MKDNSADITDKYDDNKKIVSQLVNTKSKKMRNIIAGYATRLKKAEEEI